MEENTYCVIMAGGAGTRFWPLSRQARPKQFLDILHTGQPFIRHTFDRFAAMVPPERFLVVTNAVYRELVLEAIPELASEQVLCEPIGRNTAPCIAYAAFRLAQLDPQARMIVTPADHWVEDEEALRCVVHDCLDFASTHDALLTIGLRPTRPETGYGYIQVTRGDGIGQVKTFTEKPNAEMALLFLKSGEFLWNSGIFIWRAEAILHALATHLPDLYHAFAAVRDRLGTPDESAAVERVFSECPAVSIDYGVMEKAPNVYVCAGDFGWSDVGTWSSLYLRAPKDAEGNVVPEGSCVHDTRATLVALPEGKVAVVSGLEEFIVVDTPDALLICPRREEQNLKKYVDEIRFRTGDRHI